MGVGDRGKIYREAEATFFNQITQAAAGSLNDTRTTCSHVHGSHHLFLQLYRILPIHPLFENFPHRDREVRFQTVSEVSL